MAELEQEQVTKPAKQVREQVQRAARVQEARQQERVAQDQEALRATEAQLEQPEAAVEVVLQPVLAVDTKFKIFGSIGTKELV